LKRRAVTDKGIKQVAAASGFGSADSMRRAFLRLLGITPQTYRAQLSARTRTHPHDNLKTGQPAYPIMGTRIVPLPK